MPPHDRISHPYPAVIAFFSGAFCLAYILTLGAIYGMESVFAPEMGALCLAGMSFFFNRTWAAIAPHTPLGQWCSRHAQGRGHLWITALFAAIAFTLVAQDVMNSYR